MIELLVPLGLRSSGLGMQVVVGPAVRSNNLRGEVKHGEGFENPCLAGG